LRLPASPCSRPRGGQAARRTPHGPPAAGGQQPVRGEPATLHSSPPEGDRVTPVILGYHHSGCAQREPAAWGCTIGGTRTGPRNPARAPAVCVRSRLPGRAAAACRAVPPSQPPLLESYALPNPPAGGGVGKPGFPRPAHGRSPHLPAGGRVGEPGSPMVTVEGHAHSAPRPMHTARERGRPARATAPRARCPRPQPMFTSGPMRGAHPARCTRPGSAGVPPAPRLRGYGDGPLPDPPPLGAGTRRLPPAPQRGEAGRGAERGERWSPQRRHAPPAPPRAR